MTSCDTLLSVVVVNWNRASELERCLRSVLEHTEYTPLEVIVVDNGSTDLSPAMVRASFPSVRLIENRCNKGLGQARNQGMAAAQGELIALLDCDTYVVDDVLGRSARALLARPTTHMLACELRYPDGRRQYSANRAMTIRLSLFQNLWLYRLLPKSRRAEILLGGYWEDDREIAVDWLAGAFLLVRRQVFLTSGGSNPCLYPDDAEWGIRLSRAGHRIVYAPRLGIIYHTGSEHTTEKLRQYHWAGLESYRVLNGAMLACFYWLAQFFGMTVRYAAYRALAAARPSIYATAQANLYRDLVHVYLTPYRHGHE